MSGADIAAQRLASLPSLGRPALVVVDVQRSFADPAHLGAYGLEASALSAVAECVTACARLVADARSYGVDVVWVELESDPAHPWRSSSWLQTGDADAWPDGLPCVTGTPGAEWYGLEPAPGEVRVVKHGYSGFVGTDLDETLRAHGIGWVAVVGLTTECCVFATAQDALQREYAVVVPSDATAAYTGALQAASLDMLALNVAAVTDTAALVSVWSRVEVTA